jgi:hypothetical protein
VSDIDTVVVDSLKALDPEWPIREADIDRRDGYVALCQDRTHAVQQNAWSINSSARSKKIAIDRQT